MKFKSTLTIFTLLLACVAGILCYPFAGLEDDSGSVPLPTVNLADSNFTEGNPAVNVDPPEWPAAIDRSSIYPHWTTPPNRDHDLHGLVLGPDERPITGASVIVTRPTRQGVSTLDLERNQSTELIGSTFSNEDGEFRLSLQQGSFYDLEVSAGGLHSPMRKGCQAGEYVVVRLEPSSSVEGTLTSAKTGKPQARVPVRMFRRGGKGRRHETVSDEEGHYIFPGLTKGHWFLMVSPPELASPNWGNIEVVAGERMVRDFALEEGLSLSGRVVDARSGLPIANAEISDSWVFRRVCLSDTDGNFKLVGLKEIQGDLEIYARAPGYGTRAFVKKGVDPHSAIELKLIPAKTAIGRIILEDGTPVPGVYVAAPASTWIEGKQQTDWPSTSSGADGKFELKNLRPDVRHTLQVIKPGYGSLLYEFPPNEPDLAVIDLGEILLPPAGWIAGRCHNAAGDGIAGVELKLKGWNKDRSKYGRPEDKVLGNYVGKFELTTDDLGRFRFPDLSAGTYLLSATRDGILQGEPMSIELLSDKGRDGVDLLISDGEIIGGTVFGPDHLPFANARVELRKGGGWNGVDVWTRSAEDGRFEFRSIPPGTYSLQARPSYSTPPLANNGILLPAETIDVFPGQQDVQLNLGLGQVITGQVFDGSGNPVNRVTVKALDLEGAEILSTYTDSAGKFSLPLKAGAIVNIEACQHYVFEQQSDGSGFWAPKQDAPSVVQAGVLAGASKLALFLP